VCCIEWHTQYGAAATVFGAVPVSGGDAVLREHVSSGGEDVDAVHSIAGHSEVVEVAIVHGYQYPTGVLQIHLIQHHTGERLESKRGGADRKTK